MAEIKWVKLTTDMFDNRKIRHLRRLPEGNNIVLLWVMLLTMAGRCNASGMIFLTENIPYTFKMLADELGFEETMVQMGIAAMEQLNMISTTDKGYFAIAGWEEYQNVEGMDKIREQNRIRQKKWYDKQKELPNAKPNVSLTQPNAIEEEKELDLDTDTEKEKRVNYQLIADMYNETCVSFPRLKALSDSRKKAIKARLNTYTEEDFQTLFRKAEESDFLKGKNNRNWTATFDWLVKDANMAKVLDGNYDNTQSQGQATGGRKEIVPKWMKDQDQQQSFDNRLQKDMAWLKQFSEEQAKKPELSPEYKARVEALKQSLSGGAV